MRGGRRVDGIGEDAEGRTDGLGEACKEDGGGRYERSRVLGETLKEWLRWKDLMGGLIVSV